LSFERYNANRSTFGGKVMVIGGDFQQILPVVEHGQRIDIAEACVLKSPLRQLFSIHQLEINMRARTAGSNWHDYLLRIGSGESNDEGGRTAIPDEMMCTTDIVTEIFGDVLDPSTIANLCESAVLALKNVHVQRLNQDALQRLIVDPAHDERIYKSVDEAIYPEGQSRQQYQLEYLNSLTPTGMPPHELHLEKGAIIMLLRNLDVANGLCSGTRLKVETFGHFTLRCRFNCGERNNQLAIIPRIDNCWGQRIPLRLCRHQFPMRIAFAMTTNKPQGQSFNKVGVFLPGDFFSHGQLYVALSRARRPDGIKVKACSNNLKNIVFREVLQ
uniref:ATP-dependent DNA helicase n=1 Tax=Haemonchus placei TaxID=6290 RepID=A0A0N4WCS6_HAEPC